MSPPVPLHRTALLALCGCLLVAVAGGVALGTVPGEGDAPAPEIVGDRNTSNYLQPPTDGEVREGSAVQGVDVGVAVAADAETLEGRHDRALVDQRLAAAPDRETRLERVDEAITNLSARTQRLRRVSDSVRTRYRTGAISEAEYLVRAARIEAAVDRASTDREALRLHLEEMGARTQPIYLDVQELQPDIETLSGPVTDRLLLRYAGYPNATAGSTFVRVTGEGGYVMTTVAGDRLYREAQVDSDWNRDGVDEFANDEVGSFTRARTRASDLYPWAFSHQVGVTNPPGYPTTTTLYKVLFGHQHGELSIYLDGTTTDVFREVQVKHLETLPWRWQHSASADGIQLNVSGMNPTGALEVEVTQENSDVGVNSDVRIDGTLVGSTSADGRLWTVQPSGGFTVNATNGDTNVSLEVPERGG